MVDFLSKRLLNKKKALKSKQRQSSKKKYKTLIKTYRKTLEASFKQSNIDLNNIKEIFRQTQKKLDQAAQAGVIHKNNAANKKSKLSQKINKLEKQLQFANFSSPE